MRICIYSSEYPNKLGGVGTHAYQLTKYLRRLGCEVCVITRKHHTLIEKPYIYGVPLVKIPLLHLISHARNSYSLMKRLDPDIIHFQAAAPGEIIRKTKIPHLTTIHALLDTFRHSFSKSTRFGAYSNYLAPILRKIEARNFKLSDRLIAVSNQTRFDILNQYPRLRTKPIDVVYNGVETDIFFPRSDSEFARYGKIVLYSGQLIKRKGILDFLHAIKKLNQKSKQNPTQVSFIITGKGPFAGVVRDFAQRYPNVFYLGYVKKKFLVRLYGSASIFVFPTYMEAMPYSVLEALASGLPVITTAVGGLKNLFSDFPGFGIQIPVGNSQQIQEKTEFLLNHEDIRTKFSKKAREITVNHFSCDLMTHRVLDIYKTLLEGKNGNPN